MGKLKQSVIDTPLEDQTDPRDTGSYGAEYEAEEQRKADEKEVSLCWAIFELAKAAKFLNENCHSLTVGDLQDISKATQLLQDIPSKVTKPF